jgi:hypothetical protein
MNSSPGNNVVKPEKRRRPSDVGGVPLLEYPGVSFSLFVFYRRVLFRFKVQNLAEKPISLVL